MSSPNLTLISGGRNSTPPLAEELSSCYRIRRLVEPELAAESCLLWKPEELDTLERRLSALTPQTGDLCEAYRVFPTDLLRPASTSWDLRVLSPLWEQIDTMIRAGLRAWRRPANEFLRCVHLCHLLLAAYRTRKPEVVRTAHLRYLGLSEQVGEGMLSKWVERRFPVG